MASDAVPASKVASSTDGREQVELVRRRARAATATRRERRHRSAVSSALRHGRERTRHGADTVEIEPAVPNPQRLHVGRSRRDRRRFGEIGARLRQEIQRRAC